MSVHVSVHEWGRGGGGGVLVSNGGLQELVVQLPVVLLHGLHRGGVPGENDALEHLLQQVALRCIH